MITICIELGKTTDDDFVINTKNGFPIAYIGRGSYTGNVMINTYHDFSEKEEVHLIYIGRYTSIGNNIRIYCDINHDYKSVYMGVIPEFGNPSEDAPIRERIGQATKRMRHNGTVIIGNDVWIGDDVTLISDVTIGNGAVIGAGSVVAKDIPPYTIWCGNPAVCIGNRFSPELIRGLKKISWWEWDRSRLKNAEEYMKDEPEVFVSKYEPLITDNCVSDLAFRPDNNHPVIITFLDIDSDFPTYGNIIEQFITQNPDKNTNLVLYYYNDNDQAVATIEALSGLLSKIKNKFSIFTKGIEPADDESVISEADVMIIGRDIRNIMRISMAMRYGIKCISGADNPIFNGEQ